MKYTILLTCSIPLIALQLPAMEKKLVTTTSTEQQKRPERARAYSDFDDALNDKITINHFNDTDDESCCRLCGKVFVDTLLYIPATLMVWTDTILEKLAKHKAD